VAVVHLPYAGFRVWERQKSCTVGQSGGCGTVESGEFRDFDSFLCTRSYFCGLNRLKVVLHQLTGKACTFSNWYAQLEPAKGKGAVYAGGTEKAGI
jgi:hypothetical protein